MSYQFYYWPVPFRGNFIRILLEYLEAPYQECQTLEEISSLRQQPVESHPFMAVPYFIDHDTGFRTSQMHAIVAYLGEKHGLMPTTLQKRAMTTEIIGNCLDVLSDVTCDEGSRQWDQISWDRFLDRRLTRWMQIFEFRGRESGMSDEYFFGRKISLVDLMICALWTTLTRSIPELLPLFKENAPFTSRLCDRVSSVPRISRFFIRQSEIYGDLYCGGEIEASLRRVVALMPKAS